MAARDVLQEIDASRWMPHPDDIQTASVPKAIQDLTRGTEGRQGSKCAFEIVDSAANPDVGVLREARNAVQGDRLPTHQKVVNLLVVECRKQIDQVGGEVHPGSPFATTLGPSARQPRVVRQESSSARTRDRSRRRRAPGRDRPSTAPAAAG